jgi:hypothetical protein
MNLPHRRTKGLTNEELPCNLKSAAAPFLSSPHLVLAPSRAAPFLCSSSCCCSRFSRLYRLCPCSRFNRDFVQGHHCSWLEGNEVSVVAHGLMISSVQAVMHLQPSPYTRSILVYYLYQVHTDSHCPNVHRSIINMHVDYFFHCFLYYVHAWVNPAIKVVMILDVLLCTYHIWTVWPAFLSDSTESATTINS